MDSAPPLKTPFDLHGLKTYDLQSRPSKVFVEDLGQPLPPDAGVGEWIDALPRQLAGNDLRRVRDSVCRAHQEQRTVAAALGGHVIKTGCAPYLIDWVQRGLLGAVVLNGAAAIHDFELAVAGKTSEDVAAQLPSGKFGMARETADAFAVAARCGAEKDTGLGRALGRYMDDLDCPHAGSSLVLAAYRAGIPCTIHVALGTDIVHMHPHVSGAALGEATMIDFRLLCSVVATMAHGLWFNLGSAVVLPETFLKAVAVVRNFGHDLDGLMTVNVDKEVRYRGAVNVLDRPSAEGIQLTGHHEILLPLLHAAVVCKLAATDSVRPLAAKWERVRRMSADLIDLMQRLGQPRVLVVGDVMLDRYVWGDAERISQEAPVILLHADRREERLGGASSVASMLRALGARVALAGVIGKDTDGQRLRQMLLDLGMDHEAVVADADRPTTVKERYIGRAQQRHPQQMLRVDYETRVPLPAALERELAAVIAQQIRKADIVLVSDYDKGVCTPGLLTAVIAGARACGVRVLADPIRGKDYRKYHGCSAVTPNRLEAGLATGRVLQTTAEALAAASQLREQLDLEAAVVTLDKEGMALAHRDGRGQVFPTRPRQVYDITGAGDMVLAVLGMALAAGADYEPAIRLANIAGGLEVEKIGVATVTRDEILRDLLRAGPNPVTGPAAGAEKILSRDVLCHELESRRRHGQRIAFTNGCFDVLHAGHVQYLQEARAQGDVLVVGLNSDAGVRALKGNGRPVNPVEARALVLAGLQAVDYITVFDEPTPLELIQRLRPDVLIKGADYRKDEVVGADVVEGYGGTVYLAPLRAGHSTTDVLRRLGAA